MVITSVKPQLTSQIQLAQVTPKPTAVGIIAGTTHEVARVARVIDGDTIELTDGRKIRYIGIDTPESVDPRQPVACFAKEASEKNREFVLGKEIELEKDVSETDRFGRLLRYVYVNVGNTEMMVNEGLVREGFARASSYPPDIKYQERLRIAEQVAREVGRGLWEKCMITSPTTLGTENSGSIDITQKTDLTASFNPVPADCFIKGNISSSGDKIYHLPGCGSYDKTAIDEARGEQFFCTETEAAQAGWRKAKNC